jgi:hypothetical protein
MTDMKTSPSISKSILLVVLFVAIIASQIAYDATKISLPAGTASGISPEFVRLADMGFHGAVGSFSWIQTMPEILDLYFRGNTKYLADLDFVNQVDPRLGYPYAFSAITLPALVRLPNHDAIAVAIGARGVRDADPDWRIPYYTAADYYLDLKDTASAIRYYDIAAHTPGIPAYAKQFALNFSLFPDDRAKTEALWVTIRDTTNDETLKERAQAYIDRLQIFTYLEAAAQAYKTRYGHFPATLDDLVAQGVIPEIPPDPFGYGLKINEKGVVELDLTKPPAYLK